MIWAVIVPAGSPAQRVEDLRGKGFAFTDPDSNTGKLVPTNLLASMGTAPDRFFSRTILTGSHDKSILAVAEGLVDGASVDSLIFDYAAHEIIGRNVSLLMPEPYRSAHDGYLERYRLSGRARILGQSREVEGRRRDGSVFAMDLVVTQIYRHGKPLFIGLVRDITERKRVEADRSFHSTQRESVSGPTP